MKLGIGTYTYMWSIGFPGAMPAVPMRALDLMQTALQLGVKVIQFGPNLPLRALPHKELQTALEAAREAKVELEIGMRGVCLEDIQMEAAFAKHIGCRLIRTTAEAEGEPTPSPAELESRLRAALPVLEHTGTVLAVENARLPARELARVIAVIGSEHLGVTLDTVNSLALPEGTDEVVTALATHVRCLHLKDFRIERVWHSMGFHVRGTPAGEGQLQIPRLLQTLRSASSQANAILELWPPAQATADETIRLEATWAARSVQTLRQWIDA